MEINSRIEKAFKNYKLPIAFRHYKGKANQYLTYYTYSTVFEDAVDDEFTNEVKYGTLDIYSKTNYIQIIKEVIKILKENGFTVTDLGIEDYEEDTGFHHVPVNFYYEGGI